MTALRHILREKAVVRRIRKPHPEFLTTGKPYPAAVTVRPKWLNQTSVYHGAKDAENRGLVQIAASHKIPQSQGFALVAEGLQDPARPGDCLHRIGSPAHLR